MLALVVLLLGLAGVGYAYRLTEWLAYDDEGGYLYAAWRISEGEWPYRDFMTPQLPVFLYPGALVLRVSGLSVLAVRTYMLALTLAAMAVLFLLVRRIWGDIVALLALALALPHADMFWAGRFFRPEGPMLLLGMLGLLFFVLGLESRRPVHLAAAGALCGLATMAKLFGALYVGGIGLFLLVDAACRRDARGLLRSALWIGIPYSVVVFGISGLMLARAPNFVAAVLGHHLRQGSGTPLVQVLAKGLRLYWDYARQQPVYVVLALVGLLSALRARERGGWVLAAQAPTAVSFLAMTRELQARHLTYLVPVLAALAARGLVLLWDALSGERRPVARAVPASALAGLLAIAALWPQWQQNRLVASWGERDTQPWAEFLQSQTRPDEHIMSDYPGLNFYARRRTTPLAAGISRGAAKSGQILGAELIREMQEYDVEMVLLNVAQGAHQFVFLTDYPAFKHYVQTHYALAGRRRYDYRLMEIYARRDLWPGQALALNLDHKLALTGVHWLAPEVAPGEQFQVELRWQALGAMTADYLGTLTLVDNSGHLWGLGSKLLADVDWETYWDERGLERAVLIPTSEWPLAEATVQTFELPVDLATPPGEYTVRLRVHPEGSWAGLPLLDAAGAHSAHDVSLGRVTVRHADQPPDLAQLDLGTPLDQPLGPALRLLGYRLSTDSPRPGDRVTVSMHWLAAEKPTRDYALKLLLEDDDQVWGQATASPARSDLPTSAWRAGDLYRGQYDMPIGAETPEGIYPLRLLLTADGQVVAQAELTQVAVRGRRRLYDAPAIGEAVGAEFGGVATLVGYDLPTRVVSPGGAIPLTLTWRAEARMDTAYTVFTHLMDGASQLWGQQDNPPCVGECPTTGWLPGEYIVDRYEIPVKADAPKGAYAIAVGLYDGQTGRRLPATDVEGVPLEADRVLISGITIE